MVQGISVRDVMTVDVISVDSDMPLIKAAKIIADHNFDGVPVIGKDGLLAGILTEYDLISKGSALHLPTFQFILQNLKILKEDRSKFEEEIKGISSLKVQDVMNTDPLTIREDASFEEAVMAFRDHHKVNPIPVVTADKKVVGVVSRFDVLKPLHMAVNLP